MNTELDTVQDSDEAVVAAVRWNCRRPSPHALLLRISAITLPLLLGAGCSATVPRAEFDTLSKKLTSLKKTSETLSKDLDKLKTRADSARTARAAIRGRVDDSEGTQNKSTAGLGGRISLLEAAVEVNKTLHDERTTQVEGFVTNETLAEGLGGLRRELTQQSHGIQNTLTESLDGLEDRVNVLDRSFESLWLKLRRHYSQLGQSLQGQYGLIQKQHRNFESLVASFGTSVAALMRSSRDMTSAGTELIKGLNQQTEAFAEALQTSDPGRRGSK